MNHRESRAITVLRRFRPSPTTMGVFRGLVVAVVALCAATATAEDRAMNGMGNNPDDPTMGMAFTSLMRMMPVAYEDGIAEPAGADRPNPREISNMVCDQAGASIINDRNLSDWVWQWGQFIDHDITLSEFMLPVEPFDIPVPAGDPMFDPDATGTAVVHLNRTVYDTNTGTDADNPRQQINQLTAFIDGSSVYGSDDERAAWLRTGVDGKLKTSAGNLLPFNDGTQVNAGPGGAASTSTDLFTAGDIRAGEQAALTAVHTLFMREHNRLCDEIIAEHPDWTDEEIYQRARKIVGALIQVITYHESLPALLGPNAPDPADAKYDPTIDARIANIFANACYRIGHTMLSPELMRLEEDGSEMIEGPLALRDAFFDPTRITDEGGIEPLLRGLATQQMQEIDPMVVDDVRNFLFGPPGSGGFDLASLNIQRGRDHGLPDYNTVRVSMGLARVDSFLEISSDVNIRQRLAAVYDNVDQIDPWVGGLAEDRLPGSSVGELITAVMVDQFTRLRDGDRFWYANDPEFTQREIEELEATRLSDVIERNTPIDSIQEEVFFARVAGDGGDDMPDDGGPAVCGVIGTTGWFGLLAGLGGLRLASRRRFVAGRLDCGAFTGSGAFTGRRQCTRHSEGSGSDLRNLAARHRTCPCIRHVRPEFFRTTPDRVTIRDSSLRSD